MLQKKKLTHKNKLLNRPPFIINLLFILLIIAAGFISYSNTLSNKFVWDDYPLIENNIFIRNWSYIKEIFKDQFFSTGDLHSNFYRPFQSLTLMLDYSIWRLNPFGYHLTNIILHILTAVLVFFLLLKLTSHLKIAVFSSMLFAIHPIHTEAVAYISGGADSLASVFILSSILFYIKAQLNKKLYMISMLLFIFSLLSKENALILPLLLLLYKITFNEKGKNQFFDLIPFFIITVLYIILRLTILNFQVFGSTGLNIPLANRLMTTSKIIFQYLWILIFPVNLHMERYVVIAKSIFEPVILLSIIGLILIFGASLKAYKKSKVIFFAIMWFFINLIPYSNILLLNAFMAEHWVYLASVGFFLICVSLIFRTFKRWGAYLCSSILIIYSLITVNQNKVWKDELILYKSILKYNPYSIRAHFVLGEKYTKMSLYKEAVDELQTVVRLNPKYAKAYNNLGIIYLDTNKLNLAVEQFKKALELHPNFEQPHYNLGRAHEILGQPARAKNEYEQTLKINPKFAPAYASLGNLYHQVQDYDKAINNYKQAIMFNPYLCEIYIDLGAVYEQLANYNQAIEIYKKGLQIYPDSAELHYNIGLIYKKQGWYDKAIEEYQTAIKLKQNYAEAYGNLGVAYAKKGLTEEAKKAISKSLEIDPTNEAMKQNLIKLERK